MGDEADDILASLSFSPDDSNTSTFEVVKDKFDSYFIGTRNVIINYMKGRSLISDNNRPVNL